MYDFILEYSKYQWLGPRAIWFLKLFVEGVSAGRGLIHGDFVGMFMGLSCLVSFFGGAYLQGPLICGGVLLWIFTVYNFETFTNFLRFL